MEDQEIFKLITFIESLDASFAIQYCQEDFEEFNLHSASCKYRSQAFIFSDGRTISVQELKQLLKTLLDAVLIARYLSDEGQAEAKKSFASQVYLGATNPQFSLETAKRFVDEEFNPFAYPIEILQKYGFEVKKI